MMERVTIRQGPALRVWSLVKGSGSLWWAANIPQELGK